MGAKLLPTTPTPTPDVQNSDGSICKPAPSLTIPSPEACGRGPNLFPFPADAFGLHLFGDVETDGFGHSGGIPANIVEVAAVLFDSTGVEVSAMSTVVIPEGFEITEGATAKNGLTTEMAAAHGVPLWLAMWHFDRMLLSAKSIGFHNRQFDLRVIAGAYEKLNMPVVFASKYQICTMADFVDFCRIPNKKGAGYKRPNLDELYLFLFDEPRRAAHGALVDARDCAKCYFEIQRRRGL